MNVNQRRWLWPVTGFLIGEAAFGVGERDRVLHRRALVGGESAGHKVDQGDEGGDPGGKGPWLLGDGEWVERHGRARAHRDDLAVESGDHRRVLTFGIYDHDPDPLEPGANQLDLDQKGLAGPAGGEDHAVVVLEVEAIQQDRALGRT